MSLSVYCQRLRPFVWNALESGKRMKNTKKRFFRPIIQLLSTLALNLNITGFAEGSIYTGSFKGVCVPVLNCYSCPGALGACPIGALQSSFAAIGGKIAYYVLGMLLLFALLLRTLHVARRAPDTLGSSICMGFFAMISIQTITNLGMCLNLLPVMGVTLPFFSAGGSSSACLYFGFGLVECVAMHCYTEADPVRIHRSGTFPASPAN